MQHVDIATTPAYLPRLPKEYKSVSETGSYARALLYFSTRGVKPTRRSPSAPSAEAGSSGVRLSKMAYRDLLSYNIDILLQNLQNVNTVMMQYPKPIKHTKP